MPAVEKLAGLAVIALFAAAGWGWGELLPSVRRLRPGHRHAFLYLLGIAWIAGGLYGLSHLFALPLRRPAIWIVALFPIVAGLVARALRWGRARDAGEPPPRPARRRFSATRSLAGLTMLIAAGVTLAILAEVVTHPPRDWDGRMTWSVQAKVVRAAGSVDAPALRDPATFITLSHYPLLLPVAQVVALELVGAGEDDPAPRPLYVAFFPVFLLLIWGAVRAKGSATGAALTTLLVALLPFVAFYAGGGANSSYSDLPLACFYGAGLWLLLERRLDLSSGIAGGALLAAAVLAKDEGTPLAVAALLLASGTLIWRRRALGKSRRGGEPRGARAFAALRAGAPFLVAAGLAGAAALFLAHWRAGIPLRYTPDYRGFLAERGFLGPLVERAPLLLSKIRLEMARRDLWGFLWWAAPLVLLAGRRGLRRRATPALVLAALAPLVLVTSVYVITDLPAVLPSMTWNRFLLQAGVPLFTLIGWALAEILRRVSPLGRARWQTVGKGGT